MSQAAVKSVAAGTLDIAYLEYGMEQGAANGKAGGTAVILLHGFPYDVHAYDEVAPLLAAQGCRVVVPWLRGYGGTRFHAPETPRSGQQAAIAHDLLALMDALAIDSAVLAGFDWGGRGACIVAALWPQRVLGLVSGGGYAVQDIAAAMKPAPPELEHRLWYQYYFHSERGRAGLARYRSDIGRLLWRQWSPEWAFDDATYARTAPSFDNPDFVDVVVHSYRHRFGLAPGDPAFEDTERRLASLPVIAVPTVVLHGAGNGVTPVGGSERHQRYFTGRYERRVLAGIGHNIPQEAPRAFADAVLGLL